MCTAYKNNSGTSIIATPETGRSVQQHIFFLLTVKKYAVTFLLQESTLGKIRKFREWENRSKFSEGKDGGHGFQNIDTCNNVKLLNQWRPPWRPGWTGGSRWSWAWSPLPARQTSALSRRQRDLRRGPNLTQLHRLKGQSHEDFFYDCYCA